MVFRRAAVLVTPTVHEGRLRYLRGRLFSFATKKAQAISDLSLCPQGANVLCAACAATRIEGANCCLYYTTDRLKCQPM